ncbi:hypothetical protein [Streptomyces niger]|uniref:hypothetical protein n=1 Tax=Streptomyces niger TaxID=66373 RepID=UPI000699EB87|nr:hypothetical protein [Streptomyces niger]
MSYPPPPAGDPNNPYGQQPPQGQPGYGYPQQAPQGVPPQQGYGYPQQQAYPQQQQPYGGGYPGAPQTMPGGVKAARIILFILGGLQVLGAIGTVIAGAVISSSVSDAADSPYSNSADLEKASSFGMGIAIGSAIVLLALALWAILTAAKFTTGGNGIRISAIVYASLLTLFSVISLLMLNIFALLSLAAGVLIIVFLARAEGSAWFSRQRV